MRVDGCSRRARAWFGYPVAVTSTAFALLVLAGFVLPVPLLAWLDRPRREKR